MNRRDVLTGALALGAAVAFPQRVEAVSYTKTLFFAYLKVNGVKTGTIIYDHETHEETILDGYGYTPHDWPGGWGWRKNPKMTILETYDDWFGNRRWEQEGFISPTPAAGNLVYNE